MRVEEVVVISLPERRDRRRRFKQDLPQPWPFPQPTFVPGVQEEAPAWYLSSSGAYGCRTAHLNVLRSAWRRGVNTTLVLEDDAVFCDDFPYLWQQVAPDVPEGFDMLMLGGEHALEPSPGPAPTLVRCNNTRRTHAYIIALKAIPFLIGTWSTARRHIDHSSTQFQEAAQVYAPRQFLVGQSDGFSDISQRKNPDTRFWSHTTESARAL